MDFGLTIFELSKDWIPALWNRLSQIRADRQAELNSLADSFGDPIELAKYYVEPDCQQVNPADYAEDEAIVREPLFNRLQSFISGEPTRSNNQLFILSDAGMGKTSALLMFKLAHLYAFWPTGYNCILLKLGESSIEKISSISEKRRTVLLLDALDEDPRAWGRIPQRLQELLQASKPFLRTIVTCRTQFFEARHDPFNKRGQVEVSGFLCPVVYASLFTDQQVLRYVVKRFPQESNDSLWVKRASKIVQKMGFLRMRPMLLAHLPDLMDSSETVWNEYSIYRALVDAWLLREQRKAASADVTYASRLKRACRYAAVQMQLSGRRYFSRIEADLLMRASSAGGEGTPLDLGGRSLLNKDSDGNFRFSHYSIQEFLVLEFLLANPSSPKRREVRVTDFMNQMGIAWLLQAAPAVRENRDLSFLNFRRANFDGANVDDLTLQRVDLSQAMFRRAHLQRANFSGSTLTGADFSGGVLTNAQFRDCNLSATDFSTAMLDGAQLDGAKLYGANFQGTTVEGLTASYANYDSATIWEHKPALEELGAVFQASVKKVMTEIASNSAFDTHAGADDN